MKSALRILKNRGIMKKKIFYTLKASIVVTLMLTKNLLIFLIKRAFETEKIRLRKSDSKFLNLREI